jgi:hypothetical protein
MEDAESKVHRTLTALLTAPRHRLLRRAAAFKVVLHQKDII